MRFKDFICGWFIALALINMIIGDIQIALCCFAGAGAFALVWSLRDK